MKASICLLAAGLLILPAGGNAAEKADIHEVMTAQEHHGSTAATEAHARANTRDEESVLDEEMDELGDEPVGSGAAAATAHPPDEGTVKKDVAEEQSAPQTGGSGSDTAPSTHVDGASDDAAYGAATAVEPVTLAGGDWVFIEGDERRGWFFDRAKMQRNSDGSISYWQLILYNDLGKAQFVDAMHDEAYRNVGYTLNGACSTRRKTRSAPMRSSPMTRRMRSLRTVRVTGTPPRSARTRWRQRNAMP